MERKFEPLPQRKVYTDPLLKKTYVDYHSNRRVHKNDESDEECLLPPATTILDLIEEAMDSLSIEWLSPTSGDDQDKSETSKFSSLIRKDFGDQVLDDNSVDNQSSSESTFSRVFTPKKDIDKFASQNIEQQKQVSPFTADLLKLRHQRQQIRRSNLIYNDTDSSNLISPIPNPLDCDEYDNDSTEQGDYNHTSLSSENNCKIPTNIREFVTEPYLDLYPSQNHFDFENENASKKKVIRQMKHQQTDVKQPTEDRKKKTIIVSHERLSLLKLIIENLEKTKSQEDPESKF